jgi:hypothetical protein
MNDAAADDDYVVKLPSGDARVMSLDELDAAFDAGTIHKDSPVLAPGNVTWTTLGVLAGLDEIATPVSHSPSSMAPMVFTPSSGSELEVDTALDDDDGASFAPRRRAGKVVGVLFGAVALLAVGFAIKGAISQTLATRAGEAALAAQPPAPPPPSPAPPPAPIPSPVVAAVTAAPPPPAPVAAPPPASSKAAAADKDKKKGKLPGAPSPKKKK